jgi:hypothetical protein
VGINRGIYIDLFLVRKEEYLDYLDKLEEQEGYIISSVFLLTLYSARKNEFG